MGKRRLVWFEEDFSSPIGGHLEEADTENVVFVPVTRSILPKMAEWSEPVNVRLEDHGDGTYTMLVRAVAPLSVRADRE